MWIPTETNVVLEKIVALLPKAVVMEMLLFLFMCMVLFEDKKQQMFALPLAGALLQSKSKKVSTTFCHGKCFRTVERSQAAPKCFHCVSGLSEIMRGSTGK